MSWQTAVVIGLLLVSAVTALGLAFLSWQGRQRSLVAPFMLLTTSLAIWSVFYALEIAAPTLAQKSAWGEWQYIGITFIPVGWLLFALAYAGYDRWLTRRWFALLSIVPVLSIVLAFTNEAHGWFWASYALNSGNGIATYDATYGFGWYVYFVYAYLLMGVGSVVLLWALRRFPVAYRWQLVALLVSPLLPWVSNALYVARLSPIPQLDLAPFAFTISALILGLAIFRLHLFSLLPVARTAVLDSMSEAMLVIDNDLRVVDVNPAARTLFDIEGDPVGQPVLTVLGDWSETAVSYLDIESVDEEISVTVGEQEQHFQLNITPIRSEGRQTRGRLVLLRDVTLLKQAEAALALAQVKSEFLAKVGHELRTPLNGIMGLAEMLEFGIYGSLTEEQATVTGQIVDRTKHLTSLVNDVLEQTRLESGVFSLQVAPFAVKDLVDSLVETVRRPVEAKGLTLVTEVETAVPPLLMGDQTRLYQIMLNLVDNAVKFTMAGKVTVRIAMADNSDYWQMIVQDTGVGIPAARQSQIFEAFQQLQPGLVTSQPGLGLGLAIVQQLVMAMAGDIEVHSQEDVGTRFVVTLPLMLVEELVAI